MPSRRGIGHRLAAWLGLSVLALNLLASTLLPQVSINAGLGLEICSAHEALGLEDGSPAGHPTDQNAPHCVFCLPLLQSVFVPEGTVQPVHHSLAGLTSYSPKEDFSPPVSHPAKRAAPRAPPSYT